MKETLSRLEQEPVGFWVELGAGTSAMTGLSAHFLEL
jgi:hypothetical protein